MENDLKSYVQGLFARQFGSALVGVEVRVLPHQAFVQIGVREISPEMKTFSRAMEAEFAELDRQVAVQVVLSKHSL